MPRLGSWRKTRVPKFLISYFFFFLWLGTEACQCPPTSLTAAECEKYQVIFRGRVDSVRACNQNFGEAVFIVDELYKGQVTKRFKVLFDCSDACSKGFKAGEEWIIYGNFKQINNVMMEWCSRSRKYIRIAREDYYTETLGNDYDAELKFLQTNLGLHRISEDIQNAAPNRNDRPSKGETIIYLCVSLLAVILFYWLFNRYFKF
jgi:hypothetical protein